MFSTTKAKATGCIRAMSSRYAAIQLDYGAVMTTSCCYRGVSSKVVAAPFSTFSRGYFYNNIHRSSSRRSNNNNNNYYHQQRRGTIVLLNIALFFSSSSALYFGSSTTATNSSSTFCANSEKDNNNNNDEDFISKIKSKIDSQTIISLSPQTNEVLSSILSTIIVVYTHQPILRLFRQQYQ